MATSKTSLTKTNGLDTPNDTDSLPSLFGRLGDDVMQLFNSQLALFKVEIKEEANAYANFVNYVGYTPPQKAIDADALIRRGLIPRTLAAAVVRPDQFAANQELLQLSVEGERHWDEAWSKFKAG